MKLSGGGGFREMVSMRIWTPEMPGAKWVDVYCDGKKQDGCFFLEACENPGVTTRGLIGYYVKDDRGKLVVTANGDVKQEWKTADVRWEWKQEAPESII